MVADALTKLATANVIQVLVDAMDGRLPTRTIAHLTSVTPGPANRGDVAGDGPVQNNRGSNKYLLNKININIMIVIYQSLVFGIIIVASYYDVDVYVHYDRIGSSNTTTSPDRAMQFLRRLGKLNLLSSQQDSLSASAKWLVIFCPRSLGPQESHKSESYKHDQPPSASSGLVDDY